MLLPRWTVNEWKTGWSVLFIFLETDYSLQQLVSSSKKNIKWKAIEKDQRLLSWILQKKADISVVGNFLGYHKTMTFVPLLKSMKDLGWVYVFNFNCLQEEQENHLTKVPWWINSTKIRSPTAYPCAWANPWAMLLATHHYCLFSALTNDISTS